MAINFYNTDINLKLSERKRLKLFLTNLALREACVLKGLTYVFCSDSYLLAINKKFLNHDTLTDIITFPLTEDEKYIEGEIYISIERIKENASKFRCSENDELLRVIFHGLLHLCGYGDKSKAEKFVMREKEDFYLARYHNNVV
ncbi:MAG: rRNA maturation RNase YbeY [Ferruginibacter sp.]